MTKIILSIFIIATALCIHGGSVFQNDVVNLVEMDIDVEKITLSGFSAGSTMATQMHISHSSIFYGVALFSQAYYRCGASSLVDFGLRCTTYGESLFPSYNITYHNIELSIADVYRYERQGRIDSLDNLKRQRVFMWTGAQDDLIPFEVAIQNYDFYETFISPSQLRPRDTIVNPSAKHLFPSDSFGDECSSEASKFYHIGNCSFSGAYESIRFLLGEQIRKPEANLELSSELRLFDQSEFFEGVGNIRRIGMSSKGFVYIPEVCQTTKCLFHIHFHGCSEGAAWDGSLDVARNYVKNNGLLEVAEANNIIMLFPLTSRILTNNNGCWDFFQYTGRHFATKNGAQIKVIRGMIDRISPKLVTDPPQRTTTEGEGGGSSRMCICNSILFFFLLILTQNVCKLLNLQ